MLHVQSCISADQSYCFLTFLVAAAAVVARYTENASTWILQVQTLHSNVSKPSFVFLSHHVTRMKV